MACACKSDVPQRRVLCDDECPALRLIHAHSRTVREFLGFVEHLGSGQLCGILRFGIPRREILVLFETDFFRVEETALLVSIMDSLTSLPKTGRNFRFREAVVSTLLAQCQRRVLSDDLWARFSEEQQACLLRAYARQSATSHPRAQIAASHSDFA